MGELDHCTSRPLDDRVAVLLSGEFGSSTPMFSNVVAGLIALVLVAYAGWSFHEG